MSDARTRGAAEATEVLEGLLAGLPPGGPVLPEGSDRVRLVALRAAMARSFDLYADLFQSTFETLADAAQTVLAPAVPAAEPAVVELRGRAGSSAVGELWLHNTSRAPVRGLRLRLSVLTAHDGSVVSGGEFVPAVLDAEPRTSFSATLTVALNCAPGVYHGVVLAEGLPDAVLPVRLHVDP